MMSFIRHMDVLFHNKNSDLAFPSVTPERFFLFIETGGLKRQLTPDSCDYLRAG